LEATDDFVARIVVHLQTPKEGIEALLSALSDIINKNQQKKRKRED